MANFPDNQTFAVTEVQIHTKGGISISGVSIYVISNAYEEDQRNLEKTKKLCQTTMTY